MALFLDIGPPPEMGVFQTTHPKQMPSLKQRRATSLGFGGDSSTVGFGIKLSAIRLAFG